VALEHCNQNKNTMNILNFMNEFSTIEDCEEHFRLLREPEGIVCKKCKSNIIIGLKARSNGNLKVVNSELRIAVEQ